EKVYLGYTTAKTTLAFVPNAVHALEAGASVTRGTYDLINIDGMHFDTSFYSTNYTYYLNWNWHIEPELVLNSGIYSQYLAWHLPWIAAAFVVTDSTPSYEPRMSLAWSPAEDHTFSLAYGVLRQAEPFAFAESKHYVAGYT